MRIVATVGLLVALALTVAGSMVYLLESRRIEINAKQLADQEVAELRKLQRDGIDPRTGRAPDSPDALLRLFLERNVPNDNELLAAWAGRGFRYVFGPNQELTEDLELQALVRTALADPSFRGQTVRDEFANGEVLVTIQPVRGERSQGALVVVSFLDPARAELQWMLGMFALVSGASLVAITALAAWQAGRLLAPLRELNDTALAVSGTDLGRRLEERGNDDITALTRTVNGMLDRIEEAFTGQQEFLDDAGHELRTPLTVLRGHLELLDPSDAGDVADTRALLLEEVDRMSRLVDDMLLLAKSSRPDFIKSGQVDLSRFTESVLAKASALGDREWELDAVASGTLRGDEQRLTQALLQLAHNAVKHTYPGAVVALGSTRSVEDGTVRMWVRDTGLGIDPAERALIFERFARSAFPAPGSGVPAADGSGLGLSIVRAIAEAHGGTAYVEDAEPFGARFVIALPSGAGDSWRAS